MSTETLFPPFQPVFGNSKVATNMPFFDGTILAFCQSDGEISADIPTTGTVLKRMQRDKAFAERMKDVPRKNTILYRPWKLAWCNWSDKVIHPIATGFPTKFIERCPSFYKEGERVHFSFVAGAPTSGGFFYRLYTCSGPDLDHLDTPKPTSMAPTYFGFVSPHHICRGIMNIIDLTERATGLTFRLRTSFHRVVNVSYITEDPAKLLITGLLNRQHDYQTVLHDLSTNSVSEISAGKPAYKATLHGKQLIFTDKRKGAFEDRELCYGTSSLTVSSIQISKDL